MPVKRRTATVAELQREGILLVEDGNHGEYRPRPDEFVSAGVAFIRATDIDGGKVLFDAAAKINERARQRITKGIGAPGDVLLSHKGTVGKLALVPSDATDFVCSPQTTFWRSCNTDVLDRKYLYSFMRSPDFRGQLATRAGETDMAPYVSLTSQRGLTIAFPAITEQRAIAHILGTLDDKIELNHKQNETLEAMAHTLFKAWFVDFEPVRAKLAGRWQRGQSLPARPAHLFDLFPDRLVESEFGKIPQGWEMRSLDSIANYLNGLALQKFPPESEDEFLPVIKIAQLRAGNTNGADRASTRIKPEYVVINGDVLFSWSGSLEVVIWNGGQGALNQHLFKVTSDTVPKWFYFFATRHHLQNFRAIAADKATTMGHIQRKHLTEARIAVASPKDMKNFDIVIAPLFDQLASNAQQSRSLAQLRDTLLPKLISGELRIPDIERIVGAVV